jgi:HAD superfamily hydrolase (TIGR01549 family)
MLKAIIFDYNGVLLNDLDYQVESYWKAGRDMGFNIAKETVRHYISYPPAQKKDLYFKNISESEWNKLFDLKERHYYKLIDQKNLLFPDVEKLLSSLAKHFALALVSNTVRSLFDRTFPRHLADLFQVTLFADEVNEPKPSPEPLLNIIQILGINTNECCYIGDSVEDIRMAKAAGVNIFSVPTGVCGKEELVEAGADRLITNLKELSRQPEIGEKLSA